MSLSTPVQLTVRGVPAKAESEPSPRVFAELSPEEAGDGRLRKDAHGAEPATTPTHPPRGAGATNDGRYAYQSDWRGSTVILASRVDLGMIAEKKIHPCRRISGEIPAVCGGVFAMREDRVVFARRTGTEPARPLAAGARAIVIARSGPAGRLARSAQRAIRAAPSARGARDARGQPRPRAAPVGGRGARGGIQGRPGSARAGTRRPGGSARAGTRRPGGSARAAVALDSAPYCCYKAESSSRDGSRVPGERVNDSAATESARTREGARRSRSRP
jgi:hypothetical protein